MVRNISFLFAGLAIALSVSASAKDTNTRSASANSALIAQAPTPIPTYIYWYPSSPSPWPAPIPSANAAINAAFGAGNVYNTGAGGFGSSSGLDILGTGSCNFLCFGARGVASHHVLAYGNDYQSGVSFTTQGAPDDCGSSCPGGVPNQIYSITLQSSPFVNDGYIVALDAKGNLGVYNNIIAGAALIAGAGDGSPEPSPTPGSLVSHTGLGKGEVLLGSSGNYARCDYGETANGVVNCNQPVAAQGVQPNGTSGGYAPEAFPLGQATAHPQILSGSCTAGAGLGTLCTFPNSFAFADTTYNCTVSPLSSSPIATSYIKTSDTAITIYASVAANFSYICMR
jgi:hypothetical protein